MTHLNHPSGQRRLMPAASTMHSPRLAVCALTHFHWDSRQHWWLPVYLLLHLCCAIKTNILFNLSCVWISWRQFAKRGRNRSENSLAENYGFKIVFFFTCCLFQSITDCAAESCLWYDYDWFVPLTAKQYIALCVCIFHYSYLNIIPSLFPCTVPDKA